jgi:hypothetical protein
MEHIKHSIYFVNTNRSVLFRGRYRCFSVTIVRWRESAYLIKCHIALKRMISVKSLKEMEGIVNGVASRVFEI